MNCTFIQSISGNSFLKAFMCTLSSFAPLREILSARKYKFYLLLPEVLGLTLYLQRMVFLYLGSSFASRNRNRLSWSISVFSHINFHVFPFLQMTFWASKPWTEHHQTCGQNKVCYSLVYTACFHKVRASYTTTSL